MQCLLPDDTLKHLHITICYDTQEHVFIFTWRENRHIASFTGRCLLNADLLSCSLQWRQCIHMTRYQFCLGGHLVCRSIPGLIRHRLVLARGEASPCQGSHVYNHEPCLHLSSVATGIALLSWWPIRKYIGEHQGMTCLVLNPCTSLDQYRWIVDGG